ASVHTIELVYLASTVLGSPAASETVWSPGVTEMGPVVPVLPTPAPVPATAPSIRRSKVPGSPAVRCLTTVRVPLLRVLVMVQVTASLESTCTSSEVGPPLATWPAASVHTIELVYLASTVLGSP